MKENNISYYRKQKGLTLSELAQRADISKSYLSNIERNVNQNPSIHIIQKIAAALNIELEALIGTSDVRKQWPENEWLDFVEELKASGVEKEQLHEFKTVIEYAKWRSRYPSNKGNGSNDDA